MEDICKLPAQSISPGAAVKGSRSRQRIEGGALLVQEETLGRVLGGVTVRAAKWVKIWLPALAPYGGHRRSTISE